MKKSELRTMIKEVLTEELVKKEPLTEWRSADAIKADIAKLQQELHDTEVAEKKATYSSMPTVVYAWDAYVSPTEKGTFCSAEKYNGVWEGTVFETEDDAVDAAWLHLQELDDEGELSDDPDEYLEADDFTIDVFTIPLKDIPDEVLAWSDLEHLI
jgi:hypothetical protein